MGMVSEGRRPCGEIVAASVTNERHGLQFASLALMDRR